MPTLTSLTVNLRGDSSSLVKATSKGLASIRGLSKGIGATVLKLGGLATAIAGVAGVAGAGGLVALGRASAASVDKVGKLSTQLGISGTEVQKLGLVAELSGVQSQDLVKALQRITRMLGDAGRGSKEAQKVFADLGLEWDQLNKVSPVGRLKLVSGALSRMSDETLRASLGNKLFEEQWQRLGPLLHGFEESMRRASVVFGELGFGIGDGARGVESLNDNLSVAGTMLTSFRDLVFSKVAPSINEFVTQLGGLAEAWIKANGGAGALADTLIAQIPMALSKVAGMFTTLKNAAQPFITALDWILSGLRALGTLQGGALAIGGALLEGNFAGAGAIAAQLPGDIAGAFGGADDEDPATRELERQTDLLREVVRNGATGALVF